MSGTPAPSNRFLVSLYGTPPEPLRDVFMSVVRAGTLEAGVEHNIERDYYPGHELIYCYEGQGWARLNGKTHQVGPGQMLWVNCHHPHSYGSVKSQPWKVDWIRVEGPTMDKIWSLLRADAQPLFSGIKEQPTRELFTRIFEQMQSRSTAAAAWVHAEVSTLAAHLSDSRQLHPVGPLDDLPAAIERVLQHLRLYYHKPMRVSDLAAMAGMSPSHFTRTFRAAIGYAPIDWLRHYRINQARRRLLESTDPIKEVARQVGYSDQFYFSKDFKRYTGLAPTAFRDTEGG
jgi:AraC family transcriptional regulator, arabinose operon regulatory protein